MKKKRQLIIIGDSAFAQIAYHYFNDDTDYQVAGFSVERNFLKNDKLFNCPVVPFDQLTQIFPARDYSVFVAITYGQLNRLRARLVNEVRRGGYALASYISPQAYVSKEASLGDHCFVFENNVIQPYADISDDVILWSGNHIGHHSKIGAHCFISSHVVVSGYAHIGQFCFLGVNSSIANNVIVGDDCWLGPSVVLSKNAEPGSLFAPVEAQPSSVSTYKMFKIEEFSTCLK
jgi:sugar O-acyltransferase (sialic acid O-acetyltransferase NeuD family)